MGIGHKQQSFFKSDWKHDLCHGGTLRNVRAGRGTRPLSSKEPIHVVLKVNRSRLRFGLRSAPAQNLLLQILRRYSAKFFVRVEQISLQNDHCHLLLRATRRTQFHYFFRVLAGQIAQRFEKEGLLRGRNFNVTDTPTKLQKGTGLWKYRPFSRVVRGWTALKIARAYVWLNEFEALGQIAYRKTRLRGFSIAEWEMFFKENVSD